MRIENYQVKLENQFIRLHDQDWVEKQRETGSILASIMGQLRLMIERKDVLTLLDLDSFVASEIEKAGGTATFKGYKGFPGSICLSVNRQLVHGIPTSYQLREGDLISLDFGVTKNEAIVDSAITLIYGEPKSKSHPSLLNAGQECLYNAIRAIKIGSRVGVIGNAIYKTAMNKGYGVITAFGGHGIAKGKVHAAPFVPNRATPEEGVHLVPGMCLAIEPLLVPSGCPTITKTSSDGWTVLTEDVSCHWEHTVFLHSDRLEIMTHRDNETIPREIAF